MLIENSLFGTADKVADAIKLLQDHEPPEGYYVCFSGGKDSVVILDLVKRAGVKFEAWHNITTFEQPELMKFIYAEYPEVKHTHPAKSIYQLILKKCCLPLRQVRYCCWEFKRPYGNGRFKVTGVRAEESPRRAKLPKFDFSENLRQLNLIHDWTAAEVWQYIHSHNLSYCKLYDEGQKRIGCVFCPFAKEIDNIENAAKYPQFVKYFVTALDRAIAIREEQGKRHKYNSGAEMFKAWLEGGRGKTIEDFGYTFDFDACTVTRITPKEQLKMITKKSSDLNDIGRQEGDDALANYIDYVVAEAESEIEQLEAETAEAMAKAKADKEKAEEAAKKAVAKKEVEAVAKQAADLNTIDTADLMQKMLYLKFSDQGNARRIYCMFGDVIRYDTINGIWGFFKDGVWKFNCSKDSALYPFTAKVADFIENNRPKINHIRNSDGGISLDPASANVNAETAKLGESLAQQWQKRKTQSAAIDLLKGVEDILIEQSDLDNFPMLLNVKNGTIDLETGKFYPHNPKQLLTKQANVIYDPTAKAPAFENFMQQILPDEQTRAAMLRYLGYCLTGLVNEEKIIFAYGKGGNGKGTLFGTIQYLLGDYATSFKIEYLLKKKFGNNPDAASPEIAKLNGARFAVVSESKDVRQFDTATLKDLTGGDRITARAMYQSPIIFLPTHKFILQGNNLPTPENINDLGFLRRFYIVKFEQDFSKNPNQHLKEELLEADSLSGILNILLAECLKWQKEGLIISEAMKAAKTEYRADNDFISNFITDNCELDSEGVISRKEFLTRLREEYHISRLQYKDKDLVEMITAIDGITLGKKYQNHAESFLGVKWNESEKAAPPNM